MMRQLRELWFAVLVTVALLGTVQFGLPNNAYLSGAGDETGARLIFHGVAWSPWKTVHCEWPAGADASTCVNPNTAYAPLSWSTLLFALGVLAALQLPAAYRRRGSGRRRDQAGRGV
jgi:hypothetical protein